MSLLFGLEQTYTLGKCSQNGILFLPHPCKSKIHLEKCLEELILCSVFTHWFETYPVLLCFQPMQKVSRPTFILINQEQLCEHHILSL